LKKSDKLRLDWESKGYYVINLVKTNKNGIPDYLALKEGEPPIFIESKEKWDRLSQLQKFRIKELIDHGYKVFINDKEFIKEEKEENRTSLF
jgi:hypothetical protein